MKLKAAFSQTAAFSDTPYSAPISAPTPASCSGFLLSCFYALDVQFVKRCGLE